MHIIAKQLQRRRLRLERAQRVTARSFAAIKKLQERCPHVWKHFSNVPKPFEDTERAPLWWVHRTCTICAKQDALLTDAPMCGECMLPMKDGASDPRAAEAEAQVRRGNKHVTMVFMFVCEACNALSAIPSIVDLKKAK
jgi:hypothetical protein